MRATDGNGWRLIALTMALAFVGHDLVMAGGPHPAEAAAHPASAHDAAGHEAGADPSSQDLPEPNHSSDCGVSRRVVPRPNDPSPLAGDAAATGWFAVPIYEASDAWSWLELTVPPGTRRALCQVWRI